MFKKIFIKLCNSRNEAPSSVCMKLGLSSAAFSKWTDTSIPREATLQRIADYFGVTTEYLKGEETQKENAPELRPNATFIDQKKVYWVPLFESVSAGFGATANNEIVDYLPRFIHDATEASQTICIRVRGDSMYPKIEDGDIITVHKQDAVDSGSLAVVLLDNEEALVKRIEYGATWVELQSINPMYKPLRFNGADAERIRILGVVKTITKEV